MNSRLKRILSGLIILIMLAITAMASISYAEGSTNTTDETISLGLTLWRQNDENDFYANVNGGQESGKLIGYVAEGSSVNTSTFRIGKVVKQDTLTEGETGVANIDDSAQIYCLKAGVGFRNVQDTTTEGMIYNKKYNMYQSQEQIRNIIGVDETTYKKIMWILEHLYAQEGESAKENLLKVSGVTDKIDTYKKNMEEYVQYTGNEVNYENFTITDDDIEVVQQLALWYYTNSDETTESGNKKYATNQLVDLYVNFKEEYSDETTDNFQTYVQRYDYKINGKDEIIFGTIRKEACNLLWKYLIDGANKAVDENNWTPTQNIKATFWTYEGEDKETNPRQPVVIIEKGNFDLALRKYITKVNENDIYRGPVQSIDEPYVDVSKLNTVDENGNLITTAIYKHQKEPIEIKTGDIVTYTIEIYNEGDIAGRASKIVDQLPEGLEYYANKDIETYGYKYSYNKANNTITITEDNTIIGDDDNLQPFVKGNETLDSTKITLQCKVTATATKNDKVLTNIAWIDEAIDENGTTITNQVGADRDSEPDTNPEVSQENLPNYKGNGNKENLDDPDYFYKGQQDDDDFEKLILKGQELDFSLRKFITAIGETELVDENGKYIREPVVDTSKLNEIVGGQKVTTAVYNHPKTPLTVKIGDEVIYTIRVYNEGSMDGYISKITDHLPEWLDYMPEDEVNKDYLWSYDDSSKDLRTISTDITAKDTTSGYEDIYKDRDNGKLIKAFDGGEELDFIDVKIKCRVNEKAVQGIKMTNIAEITGMTDVEGNTLDKDRDSVPGSMILPKDELLPAYRDDEINKGLEYIPGQQDDDDFEKVVVQIFDLRLRKFITGVQDNKVEEITDNTETEEGETQDNTEVIEGTYKEITDRYPQVTYKENPTVETNILEYRHPKIESPVPVVKGNIVIYTIRVYNEGEIAGYAEEITDYLEDEGLKFLPDYKTNIDYKWKMIDENGEVTTDVTKAVKVVTDYLKYEEGKDTNLIKAFDKTAEQPTDTDIKTDTDAQNPDYRDVKIAFEVVEENESQRILENAAEISANKDLNGNNIDDVDSTPDRINGNDKYEDNGNGANDEDDYDKDYVKLTCFDLALRKFITDVDGMPVNNRYPTPTYDETLGRIVYNHPKTPVEVEYQDVVIYTIRIYNEGSMNGFAQEVTDDLPDYLTFLPDHEINQKYGWVLRDAEGNKVENVDDAVCITTDYLSKDNGTITENEDGTKTNSNLLKAFSKEAGISENNPDYRDIQVAMRVDLQVTEDNLEDSKRILINEAQISEDADENGDEVKDIDSYPNRDDKYNYDGDNEDDIDYEPVKVKYFDLALKKWVTQAIVTENGKTTVTESGHTGDENPEPAMKVEIKSKSINKVNVKFRFSIKVTNQGEIAGYAKEVTDHIPEGLEFVQEDNPEWYTREENLVATKALENTLLQPGESATVEIILQWINGNSNFGLKTNYAEISEDYNSSNTPDIDSTPDNFTGEPKEDDEDEAPVVLSIKTGEAPMYFALTGTIIGMFTGGVLMIKKYVI